MRISDWSSYVCSSDLFQLARLQVELPGVRWDLADELAVVAGGHLVFPFCWAAVPMTSCVRERPGLVTLFSTPYRTPKQNVFVRYNGCSMEFNGDRKSVVQGKSESVRCDLGGGRYIKKKKTK